MTIDKKTKIKSSPSSKHPFTIEMRRLLFFFAVIQIVSSTTCPDGFDLVRDGECRGEVATMTLTFDNGLTKAIEKCGAVNAQPVIIHNEEHQNYWMARAPTTSEGFLIIGLECNSTSKKWQWIDGSEVDYKPRPGMYHTDLDNECKTGLSWDVHPDGYWNYGGYGNPISSHLCCTLQLNQPIQSGDGCNGFADDEEDGECYIVSDIASTWQDAEMSCTKVGAHLASIHNTQENSFVRRLAVSTGAVNGVFLGGSLRKDGTFGWMDGSVMDYENYYPGFPKKNFGDCLAMDTSASAGQWMNMDCTEKLPVACIRPQQTVSEPECTGEDYNEGAIITSPGFPFSASTTCDYFLAVDAGKKVVVEILLLEANSCCDSVILYDGYLGGNITPNDCMLTGDIQNANYTTKTSNIMRVSYQPKGGVNVKGLAMKFHAV